MVSTITTAAFCGIETTPVQVQVHMASGLPAFTIVGLPDKAIAESRERVRAAMMSLGLPLPAKRIVVNLAPADLAKEGSHFDVPIALALLAAQGVIPASELAEFWAMGELALDGRLLPVSGVLPAAMAAQAEDKGMICPQECGPEAAWAMPSGVLAPASLLSLINHFKGTQILTPPQPLPAARDVGATDLSQVRGQVMARRALEVAAAGGHNLLMVGPPGSGKSLLASCLPGLLPPMQPEEILEVSMIASVAGLIREGRLSSRRPFRSPHHSSSMAAMVGGGRRALPGEISLAHRGVLFLDELPEFPRGVLEALRQPLESGTISVARAQAHVTYPANVQLVAAMNPCRCGYVGDAARACGKAPRCAQDYQARLSGPLLDRIDLQVEVPAVDTLDMMRPADAEPTAVVAARVATARESQRQRYGVMGLKALTNADISGEVLQQVALPEGKGRVLLEQSVERFRLSMRGLTRVLRVARTIADLEASEQVQPHHLAEALSYRQRLEPAHTQAA